VSLNDKNKKEEKCFYKIQESNWKSGERLQAPSCLTSIELYFSFIHSQKFSIINNVGKKCQWSWAYRLMFWLPQDDYYISTLYNVLLQIVFHMQGAYMYPMNIIPETCQEHAHLIWYQCFYCYFYYILKHKVLTYLLRIVVCLICPSLSTDAALEGVGGLYPATKKLTIFLYSSFPWGRSSRESVVLKIGLLEF